MVAKKGSGITERRTQRTSTALIVLVALAMLAAGCGDDQAGNPDSELSSEQATATLRDAPPELAELRADANQLLGGGLEAFETLLDDLRGIPVVVNKWASWCGPCRFEFPFFQSQAITHQSDVAFVGIDSDDGTAAAATFLRELPLPYPSFEDPDLKIARALDTGNYFPATVFFGADGEVAHTKLGPYASEDELAADIERYASGP